MKTILIVATLLFVTFQLHAEVLLIERIEAKQNMVLPQKSATMTQVRAAFGDPLSESPAVGEPPITRWEYENFVVYFEHQYVITSVLKKSEPTEMDLDPEQ